MSGLRKATGPQPPKNLYEENLYDPYIEPTANKISKFLTDSVKGIKEGYESTMDSAGKAVDEGVADLKQMYKDLSKADATAPQPPKFKINEVSKISDEGDAPIKIGDSVSSSSPKSGAVSIEPGSMKPQRFEISRTPTSTIVPEDLGDLSSSSDADIEKMLVEKFQVPPDQLSSVRNQALRLRAKQRALRGKAMQDRGFLKFMVDEAKKKPTGE